MYENLIEELYKTADTYKGRMTDLMMLTIAKIQRLEDKVKKETNNSKIIEDINKLLEYDNSDKSCEIRDIIKKGQENS